MNSELTITRKVDALLDAWRQRALTVLLRVFCVFTLLRVALEEAIGMAYDVAKGLCPVDMDPDALLPALERLCQDVRARHGIDCRVQADRAFDIREPERLSGLPQHVTLAILCVINDCVGTLCVTDIRSMHG